MFTGGERRVNTMRAGQKAQKDSEETRREEGEAVWSLNRR